MASQKKISLVKNLKNNEPDHTIKVRIERLWKRSAKDNPTEKIIEMILVDEQVFFESKFLLLSSFILIIFYLENPNDSSLLSIL